VIRRFYVHNFRCLEHFDLTLREPSVLLILIGLDRRGDQLEEAKAG
jgi:hypothetical protein